MSQMLKSSGAMGAATLASRLLGMVREILYASFMGAGPVAAAFKLAFMVPNLFRRLLGEGALTAAFIPIFKEKEKTEGEVEMWRAANAVISGLVLSATAIIAVVVLGVSILLALDSPANLGLPSIASTESAVAGPGTEALTWVDNAENLKASFPEAGFLRPDRRLMLQLLRLMFPYMLLVCLAAIFMGMLNARGQFFLPAMGATVLNSTLILVVLFVAPRFGQSLNTQVYGLALGVLVAGAAQTAYQLPALWREGFRFRWVSPWNNAVVPLVVRKMVPGMMGVAAFQLNVLITQGIAYAVDPQIYAWFDYSVRLMELPQGLFGISLATYLLPTLSGLAADKKYPEFRSTLGQGLGYLTFSNLVATVLLIVMAEPIVRLLFERGRFSALDTRSVAFALACLSPGLVAFSMVNILARAFYALGDTQTPMKISIFCLGMNVVFTILLIGPFAQGGLGIANSLSAFLNVSLLFYALRRKLKSLQLGALWRNGLTMAGAAILAAQVAWLSSRSWEKWIGHATLSQKLGAVFIPMSFATLVYGVSLIWLRVPQAREIYLLALKRLGWATRRKQ
jgi:putative peptidoglycan lipid II flippase